MKSLFKLMNGKSFREFNQFCFARGKSQFLLISINFNELTQNSQNTHHLQSDECCSYHLLRALALQGNQTLKKLTVNIIHYPPPESPFYSKN